MGWLAPEYDIGSSAADAYSGCISGFKAARPYFRRLGRKRGGVLSSAAVFIEVSIEVYTYGLGCRVLLLAARTLGSPTSNRYLRNKPTTRACNRLSMHRFVWISSRFWKPARRLTSPRKSGRVSYQQQHQNRNVPSSCISTISKIRACSPDYDGVSDCIIDLPQIEVRGRGEDFTKVFYDFPFMEAGPYFWLRERRLFIKSCSMFEFCSSRQIVSFMPVF